MTTTTAHTPGPWEIIYPLQVERSSIDNEPQGADLRSHISSWAVVDDDGNWVAQDIPTRELAEQFAIAPEMFDALLDAKRYLQKALEEIRFGNPEDNAEHLVQSAFDAVMKGLNAHEG